MSRWKRKVLLIDDQPLVREGLSLLINREPDLEICGSFGNGRLAMQAIANLRPDIVIIDPSLDGKGGVDSIKEIACGSWRVPILVLSIYKDMFFVEHALRAGAKGYALKHEDTSRVINAIRHVLNGRTYIADGLSGPLLERLIDILPGGRNSGGVGSLSDRELRVFGLIGVGMTTGQIAEKLHVSTKTVETYRARMKTKLGLRNNIELRQYAIRWEKSLQDNETLS